MSYEPTTWRTGDVVTSAKLNKLEQGVADAGGGGVTIVHAALNSQGVGSLDMTAGEILAAAQTGPVILVETAEGYGVIGAGPVGITKALGNEYLLSSVSNISYKAASADAYPENEGSM